MAKTVIFVPFAQVLDNHTNLVVPLMSHATKVLATIQHPAC